MQLSKFENQIIRIDGKDSFVEVTNDLFHYGKVILRFIKYNDKAEKGKKFVHDISIFLEFEKFLALKQDILSGRMTALAKAAKETAAKGGYSFAKHIYSQLGGKPAERLNDADKAKYAQYGIPTTASLSRQFKIAPGAKDNYPFVLSAEWGAGELTDTGLITPKGKPVETVRIPMSGDAVKELVLLVEKHIDAYITAQYQMELMHPSPKPQYN